MSQPTSFDPYAMPPDAIQEPPQSLWQALRKIGPGIILAGSIVGSGELILTTKLGAEYGFIFLWLILFSCVIKVFVQIELGRYAISSGKPTLGGLNEFPGPRLGANWLVWWWFVMLLGTVFQLGAMAGGVGQALDLAFPRVSVALAESLSGVMPSLAERIRVRPADPWAVFTALTAVALLLSGGYRRIELVTTFMVATVTAATVLCVLVLPKTGYPILISDLAEGFKFILPAAGLATAFAVFGITGVGASELFAYPYWCLEKGYARFAGAQEPSEDWVRRARGWIRVMCLDAWASMIVFTIATVAFYSLGATVLHRQGLVPKEGKMIDTLSQMYVGVFGTWTTIAFLIGAWAVLFKTLYVATASNSRLMADFLSLAGFARYNDPAARGRMIRRFCVIFPLVALAEYLWMGDPTVMVMIGGLAQASTLPVLSGAALYMRYRRTDPRLAPSRTQDVLLWCAGISISVVAVYFIWSKLAPLVASS